MARSKKQFFYLLFLVFIRRKKYTRQYKHKINQPARRFAIAAPLYYGRKIRENM